MQQRRAIVRFDIGGVTRIKKFTQQGVQYALLPGVVECVALLVRQLSPESVGIISRCELDREQQVLAWLESRNFFQRTGVRPINVNFVRETQHKSEIWRRVGATHVIENRAETLSYAPFIPHRFLFRGKPAETKPFRAILPDLIQEVTWVKLYRRILTTLN